jgi:hypothetical protein
LILLSWFGCTSGNVAVGVPWLEVPPSATFEGVLVGAPNVLGVAVRNTGTATAEVSAVATEPFLVTTELLLVEPGQEGLVPLLVEPADYAELRGSLAVSSPSEGELEEHITEEHTVELLALPEPDADGDGDPAAAAGGTDCDDGDPSRSGAALEVCNRIDDDCDGIEDDVEPLPEAWPDTDEDGYGDAQAEPFLGCYPPPGYVLEHTDCDDSDGSAHPGAPELWYDGADQACDGGDDYDQDGDTFRAEDSGGDDCDDTDPDRHPGVPEIWYDGLDQDCDGNDDDQDGDGDPGGPLGTDCDDLNAALGPSVPELDDGLDQDCDSYVDEGLFSRGTLLLTELMIDPDAVSDANGRYLELYNPTDGHVELGLVTLDVGNHSLALPSLFLAPGSALVLCSDQNTLQNGGVACGGPLQWIGSVQDITVRAAGLTLDELDWQSWSNPPEGSSWELAATSLDPDLNDPESAWCTADDPLPAGDQGSPGLVAGQCQ